MLTLRSLCPAVACATFFAAGCALDPGGETSSLDDEDHTGCVELEDGLYDCSDATELAAEDSAATAAPDQVAVATSYGYTYDPAGCYYCSDLKSWANGFCDLYFDLQLTSYHCHACNSAHYDHIHFNCGRWAIAGDSPVELPTAPGGTIGDLDRQESAR